MSNETFLRIEQLIGRDGLEKLRGSFVTIIGIGAVGGYAMEALARSGIGRLRLVDFDTVKESNINRQLLANRETIGRKKIDLATERIRTINPDCIVEPFDIFVHKDTTERILEGEPDFVIDAIDSLNPKVELVASLSESGLPAVSSMGAGMRTDPMQIRIGKLSEVTHCPLAAILRKKLRKKGIDPQYPCIYSNEPIPPGFRPSNRESEPNEYPQGRQRVPVGSLPSIPGIFGLIAANMAIKSILKL